MEYFSLHVTDKIAGTFNFIEYKIVEKTLNFRKLWLLKVAQINKVSRETNECYEYYQILML